MSNGTYGFRFLQVYLILKIMPLTEMQNFFPCLLHFLLIPVDPLNHILNVTFEAQYHVQSLKTEKMVFLLSSLSSHLPKLGPFAKISKSTSVHLPLGTVNYYTA